MTAVGAPILTAVPSSPEKGRILARLSLAKPHRSGIFRQLSAFNGLTQLTH